MDWRRRATKRWMLALLVALTPAGARAAEHCKLLTLAEVPVSLDGPRPFIDAKINGTDARFVLDSGAFWSMLSTAAAAQYGLKLDRSKAIGLSVHGLGGSVSPAVATVKDFTIFNVPVHNVEFLVAGSNVGNGAVGLLGQNILRLADIEYDFAHGFIRFFRTEHCEHADLAYWAKPGEGYSVMKIEPASITEPHIVGEAEVGGVKVRVMFDTGVYASMISLRVAKRAGITPDSPGVTPAGEGAGIGRMSFPTWTATFPSFRIGGEEIRNARLRFADIPATLDTDMLLGSDFFLSHRIYVANRSHKLYFTYAGGPVFDLRPRTARKADAGQPLAGTDAGDTPTPAASAGTPALDSRDAPKDAAGFARRAGVLAARNDLDGALADWTRACELAPTEPAYFFQRGRLHARRGETELALKDLEETLHLNPDHVDALLVHAGMQIDARHVDVALEDLARADRAAPRGGDVRLSIASMYMSAERPEAAVPQFDQWIDAHQDDGRLAQALNGRCWARTLVGRELEAALKDCNQALRIHPKAPDILDSRALAYLRLGRYDKAIADYDAALQNHARNAWSLYGRGVAKMRQGLKTEGEADIDAAKAADPEAVRSAEKYGIVP